jgi:2-oxoglutarate dehydrogenase E2 component (dihydrolipoamide succinyltransferase)
MALVDLIMPKLGESIMEATILKWHKKPGEPVKQDEAILDIATDKVDSEVPSTAAGTLAEILFKENDVVAIGTVIARIETSATATVQTHTTPDSPAANPAPTQVAEVTAPAEVPYVPMSVPASNGNGKSRFYSPLVLTIAGTEGVSMAELETIQGTGNEGRVTKKDILNYVSNKKSGAISNTSTSAATPAQPAVVTTAPIISTATPATPPTAEKVYEGNVEIIEMDRMRKLIAKHMVDSKHTSPHVTSFAEADVTNMVLWREKQKRNFEKENGTRLTFTPMFIDCLVRVIKKYPMINCSLDGDKIIVKKDLNIGMATALPTGNLIVPVIKNADHFNMVGLSKAVNSLADAARSNKLKPDDTVGGTFTLTNVGTFGSLMGTPIINQPQVAIMAVGAIKKRPVVIETEQGDTIGIRHMMYLSLSYDHRIVDGSLGASFLTAVAKEFEAWDLERAV